MNIDGLQDIYDRLTITSWQRWLFVAIALVAAVGASMITGAVSGHLTGVVVVFVFALAATACARADSHTALVAEAVVLWQWLATVDDVSSPWTLGVALCLSVFHALVALMAVTPITAVVAPAILRCWVQRVLIVGAATVAVWVCVLVLDERRVPGNALLTAVAFVTLTVLAFVARAHSGASDQSEPTEPSGPTPGPADSPGYDDAGKFSRA